MPTRDLVNRFPRQLSLRELRFFVTVLDEGSFRRAAAALHVSQPAVTKTIAGLEALVGVKLFDRARDGVEPTLQGSSLAPYARAVFQELRGAAQELDFVSRGATGTLRLGTVQLPAAGFLPLAIRAILARNPGVLVSIAEGREPDVCDLLRKREIDIALVRLAQIPPSPDLDIDVLFEAQLYVLAARNHRLASRPVVTWEEILEESWVMSPASSEFVQHVRHTLGRAGLAMPRHCVETPSVHVQRALVMHAGMLSFGSRPPRPLSPMEDVLVRLPFELPRSINAIGAVTLKSHERRPLATQLIAEIRRLATSDDREVFGNPGG